MNSPAHGLLVTIAQVRPLEVQFPQSYGRQVYGGAGVLSVPGSRHVVPST